MVSSANMNHKQIVTSKSSSIHNNQTQPPQQQHHHHHHHHSRHNSLNSINLNQSLLGTKIISLHEHQPTITANNTAAGKHHTCSNGHLFRHYHYHLDNNIQINSSMDSIFQCSVSNSTRDQSNSMLINNNVAQQIGGGKWTKLEPELLSIAINNYYYDETSSSQKNDVRKAHRLPLRIGDVLVLVERFGRLWFRGYLEHEPNRLGIFPANHVQVFDDDRVDRFNEQNNNNCWTFLYYTLLDPLYLQVVRILREWHHHLQSLYRTNVDMEKFLIVRNLIYELLELCSTLNKDLAPSLWRKRSCQLLKHNTNNNNKDPFDKLYVGEEDPNTNQSTSIPDSDNDTSSACQDDQQQLRRLSSVTTTATTTSTIMFDSSLEDLYERILSKLNQGNQHLNLDILPSFTHGTFMNNLNQKKDLKQQTIAAWESSSSILNKSGRNASLIKKRSKFRPYYINDNCKYLTHILDYYNHINRRFNQKFKSNITPSTTTAAMNNSPKLINHRHSFSSFVTGQSLLMTAAPSISNISATTTAASSPNNSLIRKFRRHLLLMIREADFSNLPNLVQDNDQLQIDAYILRCNDSSQSSSVCSTMAQNGPYEVLTEKYCYRFNAHQPQNVVHHNHHPSFKNVNRALFLDVLNKRTPQNGLSSTVVGGNGGSGGGGGGGGGSSSSNHHHQFQSSDVSNHYLIIQVWRHGRLLVNDGGGRTKNMLSATSSLTTGSSVFHTISSATSSIASSAAAAASSNSLSSITSFVSNSSLFNNNNSNNINSSSTDKSNSSGTPDSSSIDSSEFGSPHFKRSVGFSVIPLLELVSRDKEIRPTAEMFQDENFLGKILFSDESMLLPVTVKLYEGDLTVSVLETVLKHRQAFNLNQFSSHQSSSQSSASISKLSPLSQNGYQLVVCAKFISELMIQQNHHSSTNATSSIANFKRLSNPTAATLDNASNIQAAPQPPVAISLADHLLTLQNDSSSGLVMMNGNEHLCLVQKRCFGDLVMASHFRNDFYLTLDSAEFEKGGKTIPKNIEVSVCLITETGVQERAIQCGVNMEPCTIYRSHIQYHQNSPKWFEHIKVDVPLEQFETAHLRFVFCHCSSKERERKFLGFSFLPLADQNGACLPDGLHELYIYKCDSERKLDDVAFYMNGMIPWGHDDKMVATGLNANGSATGSSSSSLHTSLLLNSRSPKEVFHVKTTLVSSKLTQNSDILSLLKWSCTPLEQVYDSMKRFGRVPGEEVVKFLEDILDALFALFTTAATADHSCPPTETNQTNQTTPTTTVLIFRVIVDFFKTLNDPKFSSYRSALEKYIERQFSAPLVYGGLIRCVKKYLELVVVSVQQNETTGSISGVTKRELEFILRCLSVFDWILKIIVQSRILYTKAAISGNLILNIQDPSPEQEINKPEIIQSDEEFKEELFSLFAAIQRLLVVECRSSDDYLIVAIKESVLNSLPNAFSYLAQTLKPLELAKLIQSLVNLNYGNSNNNSINRLSTNSECLSPISSSSITPTNSTPTSNGSTTKKTIINAKLLLLQHSIQFKHVWLNEESRLELLATFIRMLNICITESKHCLYILRDVIIYLIDNAAFDCCKVKRKRSGTHPNEKEIEMLSIGAIDDIVEHIIELIGVVPASFDVVFQHPTSMHHHSTMTINPFKLANGLHSDQCDYLGTMIICLLVVLDFMTLKHYEKLFEKRSQSQCKELLLNIFAVFLNALYYFPDNWLEIKMAINRILLHSLTMLRTIMSQKFLGPERFDETIWRMYFKLAIAFLIQPRLQLHSQHYCKRRFLLDTYGNDIRIQMGLELVQCWELIGPFKISFIPSLVAPFIDVTLVPELELRKATIPIFYDMLMVDYLSVGNFKQVEAAMIDKLDAVAHRSECDSKFKELFTQILTDKIEQNKPVWIQDGLKLVQSVSKLLTLLIDYRNELKRKHHSATVCNIINHNITGHHLGGSVNGLKSAAQNPVFDVDDRLLICTYIILKFFRDDIESMNRKTIMLRYLEKLANIHTLLGNYAEAAFTLKLHADQLQWSNSEALKKESLCQTMLNYFEKGQCWEEGINVCKELQVVYEKNYKYSKLSTILKRQAELLDKILTEHRSENEYFRVSFYGLDFPSFLQNSTFIFRGLEFEKISTFTHRIQLEFPNAQLLTKVIPTDENITESKCQYIQIFSVKPIPEPPVSSDQTLLFGQADNNVFNYYNTNSVRQFIQDRPIQRAPFDPNNEFKSLWIERTTYTTEQPLPGMLKMFKVVQTLVTYLSPIENACETIENKNMELSKLIATYSSNETTNGQKLDSISPLSMRLQGILDAAVNGGIAKYIDAFLGSEFLSTNPDQVSNVSRLKDRIANQIQIVEAGLTLHGRLAPTPIRPLHTRLLERFAIMRNTVHQANIETSQALLWAPNNSSSSSSSLLLHRPSILSQPLPPIPQRHNSLQLHHHHLHHHLYPDTSSDPDTSSLSSTSSSQTTNNINHLLNQNERTMRTPPPYTQSPGSKSLKNKPLPPLPPTSNNTDQQQPDVQPWSIKRHHSNIEHRSKPSKSSTVEDSIYSVPQYTDLDLPDNESSVDDSMDYCDVQVEPINGAACVGGGGGGGDTIDSAKILVLNNSRINRSLSIPGSTLSLYNGFDGSIALMKRSTPTPPPLPPLPPQQPPPPLPPRSSTLDRSNSLNSGVTRPSSNHSAAATTAASALGQTVGSSTGLPPPALPQRPVKRSIACNDLSNSNVKPQPPSLENDSAVPIAPPSSPPPPPPPSTTTEHFATLDGLEFEDLVISSPTPKSSFHQSTSNRPAPIIGIEINNNDTVMDNEHLSFVSATDPGIGPIRVADEHRTKSNSLPKGLQPQFNGSNYETLLVNNNNNNNTNNNNNNMANSSNENTSATTIRIVDNQQHTGNNNNNQANDLKTSSLIN